MCETYTSENYSHSSKVYMFDVDGTLVTTKSGRPSYSPIDVYDYMFYSGVLEKLEELMKRGYSIVLISNQKRFTPLIKSKFNNIYQKLERAGIKIVAFILKSTEYQKPSALVFDDIQKMWPVSITKVRYCGDACGALHSKDYPPYEWSDVDYEFYNNLNIKNKKFYRPQQVFKNKLKLEVETEKSFIMLVGNPGSRKTWVAQKLAEQGFTHICGDTHGTVAKQKQLLQRALAKNQNVIIDNTNGRKEKRNEFLDLAREHNYFTTIIWLVPDGRPFNKQRDSPVPEVAYNVYSKYFVEPASDEADRLIVYCHHTPI